MFLKTKNNNVKQYMEQFNLNSVIEQYKLNTEELAKVLFPSVKYPKQALDRILKGEADLDVKQLQALAYHLGVLISDLFQSANANNWYGVSEDNCLCFIKGEFKIKLNYNGVYITVYKNNNVVDKIIADVPSMSIEQFKEYINNLIENY